MQYIRLFIISAAMLALSSCASYQLFYTQAKEPQLEKNCYVYEDEMIKIYYSFFEDHGNMNILVQNKADFPVYIDWSKSAYVSNTFKENYWNETTLANSGTIAITDFSEIWGIALSMYASSSISYKPEKITFIPPNSYICRHFQKLFKESIYKFPPGKKIIRETINGKKVRLMREEFNETNTPLIFRNYLTYSTNELMSPEYHIDNAFFISKVIVCNLHKKQHFDTDLTNFYIQYPAGLKSFIHSKFDYSDPVYGD